MLTRANLRDEIAKRTGYRKDTVAHVLDVFEELVRDELVQQGEVALRGLFRVVPARRQYLKRRPASLPLHAYEEQHVTRIILTIRPMRSLRKLLSRALPPG